MRTYSIILVVSLYLLCGCTNHNSEHEHHDHHEHSHEEIHQDNHTHEEVVNSVKFTHQQSQIIDFEVREIYPSQFGQIIKTVARVMPSQTDEQVVVAKMHGIVSFSDKEIVPGKAVRIGESLLSIIGSGFVEDNIAVKFKEIETEYNRAKIEYERKKELITRGLVSQKDLLEAEIEFENAQIRYNTIKNDFSYGRLNITSPIDGYIRSVEVQNGEHVDEGHTVIIISKNETLLLRAEIPPQYYDLLGNITDVNITPNSHNSTTYSIEDYDGHIISYGKSVDINNPLIPITFAINNKLDLLPGSMIKMYIQTKGNKEVMVVPNKALIEEMGDYFVFVQIHDELYEKRAVTIGHSNGLETEIIEGLKPGETIVTKGALNIKLSQSSEALDAHAGHVH